MWYNLRKNLVLVQLKATLILPKLYGQPIVNVPVIQKWTKYTRAGAGRVIDRLVNLKILVPKDQDKKYGQSYMFKEYLDIFADEI